MARKRQLEEELEKNEGANALKEKKQKLKVEADSIAKEIAKKRFPMNSSQLIIFANSLLIEIL